MDTIAAIAAGTGNYGISKIRMSGDDAIEVADRIYRSPGGTKRLADQKSHTIHYGYIEDGGKIIDEVIVLLFRAPRSYTREDIVEIDCHGGIMAINAILDACLKNGARTAEPGEFTKRAFLNGRIDLTRAEAVMDIISSKNRMAMDNSVKQLKGALYEKIRALRESILNDVAYIEAALDDPEHIPMEGFGEELDPRLSEGIKAIERLTESFNEGRIIKEGIKTVIAGKPNAGKSSLLNMLLGEERAIVTEVAGTTRDTLEEYVDLQGITLNIIDTAGIRDTADTVEKIGVERAMSAIKNADLIIFVADKSTDFDERDRAILKALPDKKKIVVLNKKDVDETVTDREMLEKETGEEVLEISAKYGSGRDELTERIKKLFFSGEIAMNDEVFITSARHREALKAASESLTRVRESIAAGMPEDLYTIDMMDAYKYLGSIIGESVEDDIADRVFERFCMGK
ncbi:MAG: tRNA uridine-5-carboxymethylaminomethyl(34) synthesis GTPase MnmE [Lachnospiraceae bacterium]|nr:tRNA uridine-5-carboxymethylaminomethyl(34) synthesis GTPase MnmE [Lachnospiraceae bacterium]